MKLKAPQWIALVLSSAFISSACSESGTNEYISNPQVVFEEIPGKDASSAYLREWAYQALIAECTVSQGYSYEIDRYPPGDSLDYPTSLFSVVNPEQVNKFGYHNSVDEENDELPSILDIEYYDELGADRLNERSNIINGGDEATPVEIQFADGTTGGQFIGGCKLEALEELYDDPLVYLKLSRSIDYLAVINIMYSYVIDSTAYEEVASKWSDCMDSRGYDFDTPADAENYAYTSAFTADGEEASSEEIELAMIHLECNNDSQLVEVSLDVLLDEVTDFKEINAGLYSNLESLIEKADPIAESVVNRYR